MSLLFRSCKPSIVGAGLGGCRVVDRFLSRFHQFCIVFAVYLGSHRFRGFLSGECNLALCSLSTALSLFPLALFVEFMPVVMVTVVWDSGALPQRWPTCVVLFLLFLLLRLLLR